MGKSVFLLRVLLVIASANSISGVAVGPIDGPVVFPRFTEPLGSSDFHLDSDYSRAQARFRLPNQIVPRHYNLEIRPILNEGEVGRFTAPGLVKITVECLEATNNLVLHASDLNISTVQVSRTSAPTEKLAILSQTLEPINETLTLQVNETLVVGQQYDIQVDYVANIADPNDRMNGIYRSSYVNAAGETRYLATTQFSRTRAFRKMLPSFDEPSQKATFEISIGKQDPYHTLSNMDIRITEPIANLPGWTWDRYNPTPVMAPTIIALIVSDFTSETAPPDLFDPAKPCKIWGPPPEMANDGGVFAATTAAQTLKYFQDYFQIDYELPKIDSAAIPDFAAGAMENWGLNTYRVMYLIWKDGINTVAEKFRVANILGHELAHQYWGNLVTHAWWNDWWLTEGFASYFEYRSVDEIYPDFEAMKRLVTSDVQPAMEFDAGLESVPIHGNVTWDFVENPSTINYSKGAALVGMMRYFMTEQVFKLATSYYLKNRAYTAVHQDALFDDLTDYLRTNNALPSNNKTVKEIMDTWTLQTSFPLVRVSRAGPSTIYLSQEKFKTAAVREAQQQEPDYLWYVPVSYISQSNPDFNDGNTLPNVWIDKDVLVMSHSFDTNQWILVNPNGQGYYRVLYDNHFATLLKSQLVANVDSIPVNSRSMIVDDYFTSAFQGYITIEEALDMTTFINKETDYNVWVPFMKHLRKGYEMYSSNAAEYDVFKNYIFTSMETAFIKIGYKQIPNENPMTTILRVQLFDWACAMFQTNCVAEANLLLDQWKNNPTNNPVPLDIRQHIYCASTSVSTNGNWDFLLTQYDSTKDALVRNALACSLNATQLQSLLDKTISDSTIPQPDIVALVQRVAMNSVGRPLVVNLLENNLPNLANNSLLGTDGVSQVMSTLGTYLRDEPTHTRLEALVQANQAVLQPVLGAINTALAKIPANIKWIGTFGNRIQTWFKTV